MRSNVHDKWQHDKWEQTKDKTIAIKPGPKSKPKVHKSEKSKPFYCNSKKALDRI